MSGIFKFRGMDDPHPDDFRAAQLLSDKLGIHPDDIIILTMSPKIESMEYDIEFLIVKRRRARIPGKAFR